MYSKPPGMVNFENKEVANKGLITAVKLAKPFKDP